MRLTHARFIKGSRFREKNIYIKDNFKYDTMNNLSQKLSTKSYILNSIDKIVDKSEEPRENTAKPVQRDVCTDALSCNDRFFFFKPFKRRLRYFWIGNTRREK